jgi:hypothetical protein
MLGYDVQDLARSVIQIFRDINRDTGRWQNELSEDELQQSFVVAMTFLRLNGLDVDSPQEETYEQFLGLAKGIISEEQLSAWIRERAKPIAGVFITPYRARRRSRLLVMPKSPRHQHLAAFRVFKEPCFPLF